MASSPVIYFDGVCNLCTAAVQFLLKKDRKKIFRYASLQGEAGQNMLALNQLTSHQHKTFILEAEGRIFMRSRAALEVAKQLGGLWSLLYAFIIIPPFIRDGIYNYISEHRYKWFGTKQTCWIPNEEWKNRFLD